MATYYDAEGNEVEFPDADDDNERLAQVPRRVIRKLEKDAKDAEKLRAENEQLKRERAFVQAGIPLDDKRAAYFIAGYQGEQNAEAIKQEWQESFGGSSTQQPNQIDLELQAQQGAENLVNGVGAGSPDLLAQRNAEIAALSPTDVLYPQKFDAIVAKYGGKVGNMHG